MNIEGVSDALTKSESELLFLKMKRRYPELINYNLGDLVLSVETYEVSKKTLKVVGMVRREWDYGYCVELKEPGSKEVFESSVFSTVKRSSDSDADLVSMLFNMNVSQYESWENGECMDETYDGIPDASTGDMLTRNSDGKLFRVIGMDNDMKVVVEPCDGGKRELFSLNDIKSLFNADSYVEGFFKGETTGNREFMEKHRNLFEHYLKVNGKDAFNGVSIGDCVVFEGAEESVLLKVLGCTEEGDAFVVEERDRKSGRFIRITNVCVSHVTKADSSCQGGFPCCGEGDEE